MTKKPKRKNFSHFICYFYQRRIIESSEKQLVNYPILSVTRIKLNDMRKYFLYACLLFAGVFTACDNDDSDGIDPSIPFYQNLGVEYNVTQNHTHIGANFNKYNSEGANLRLPAKGILFNGKVPDFLGMGAYMYMLSESGLDPVTFTFSRWKDQVYTNKASIDDVDPIALPESLTSVKGNGATIITWVGKPIGKDEYVQVHLTYSGGVYDINNTQEGATSITLNFTNPTSATKGTLFLSRVRELPLQESNGDAGGKIDGFYVHNKGVTFE